MSKKKERQQTALAATPEELMQSVTLQDKDGNYVHIGDYVATNEPTEEEAAEVEEAKQWYDIMLDPDTVIEIVDLGVSTGEDSVEPT
jgi:hypothetical protein